MSNRRRLTVAGFFCLFANLLLADTAFLAVWRPGSGTQWCKAGMTEDEFKTRDKAYFDQGLRIKSIAVKGGKFAAVWRPGSGEQRWQAGMSADAFKAKDQSWFDKGLRLVALKVNGGSFTAVWQPGSGEQRVQAGMSLDEFKAKDKAWFDKGLRLFVLERDGGAYTAVWRPGSGAQHWQGDMSADELEAKDKSWFDKGLRMTVLSADGNTYTAVWRPGNGAQWWYSHLAADDFATVDKAHYDGGLRLQAIDLQSDAVGLYKLPFNDDTNWKLFQGNFDDPKAGHPDSGATTVGNNQKYAFDFAYDSNNNGIGESGKTIRAARAGTVYALQESEEGNSYAKGTTEEGVKRSGPWPAGYKGVGNFLVIRHHDGTFGTYWHLKKDGVAVNVGDKVTQGQVVATSDDTGNSTTPHMHFDVRTGWSLGYPADGLEYPGVKILFRDKNHSAWVPRVGDTLESGNP